MLLDFTETNTPLVQYNFRVMINILNSYYHEVVILEPTWPQGNQLATARAETIQRTLPGLMN